MWYDSGRMKKVTAKQALTINSVSVLVDSKTVTSDFSLSLAPGETHVLMGPNGSGKSSLAYALAGHPSYEITSGSVQLDGVELLPLSPDERATQGLLLAFQYPVEVPGLAIWQFLWQAYQQRFAEAEPSNHKKIIKAIDFIKHLEKIADQLKIPSAMLKRGLNEGLSGGEKKRIELLQLIVLQPKYAILDETDSGLDIDAIKIIAKNIQYLTKELNVGCLIITHYQRLLQYVVPDAVHVMVHGKLVESGDASLVKKLEKEGYTAYYSKK